MPWMETAPVEQRERFIADHRAGHLTMTELCRRYGISRKTGYKWLRRHAEEGRPGLKDRSHAPHHCPHRLEPAIAELILRARRRHPDWGPRKLLTWLGVPSPEDLVVAGGQHGGRFAGPERVGEEAAATTAPTAPGGGTADHRGAQRPVDRRLQGPVSHPKRRLVLPLDDQRSAHPVSAELPRSAGHQDPGRPTGLRAHLPGVRAASSHPHRQRGALHLPRSAGARAAQRLVAAAGHPASADPARLAAGKRRSRAHASHPESRDLPAPRPTRRRSRGPSIVFGVSTTRSDPTRPSTARSPAPGTAGPLGPIPTPCRPSSTRATSWSNTSPAPVPSDSGTS